mmetsp:Transcript_21435/g.53121  ORF Transcript_21435/g.53121 Transcript_21435/m.53121 type:complete len:249 (-) Transcript_21435:1530-2276(-)
MLILGQQFDTLVDQVVRYKLARCRFISSAARQSCRILVSAIGTLSQRWYCCRKRWNHDSVGIFWWYCCRKRRNYDSIGIVACIIVAFRRSCYSDNLGRLGWPRCRNILTWRHNIRPWKRWKNICHKLFGLLAAALTALLLIDFFLAELEVVFSSLADHVSVSFQASLPNIPDSRKAVRARTDQSVGSQFGPRDHVGPSLVSSQNGNRSSILQTPHPHIAVHGGSRQKAIVHRNINIVDNPGMSLQSTN